MPPKRGSKRSTKQGSPGKLKRVGTRADETTVYKGADGKVYFRTPQDRVYVVKSGRHRRLVRDKSELEAVRAMSRGREYFGALSRELHLDGLDPTEIRHLEPLKLRQGAVESKLGGRITRDLKRPSPEETVERRRKSEEFLSQPSRHFAAEEDSEE